MLNLIHIDNIPLENPGDCAYSRMAFDGMNFYCCTGKSSKIFKLNLQGELVCCIETMHAYSSLCFDCVEECFWAITSDCRSSIYKLNNCLREIGTIGFSCKDRCYCDISYDAPEDILVLCSGDVVVKVSKSGFLLPLYNGNKSVQYESATQVFDDYLITCKFPLGGPDIIGILCQNSCFDYLTCMSAPVIK